MLKFSKKFEKKIAKENEISFEIFGNILFVKMEFQNEIMKKKKKQTNKTKQNQADCHILALLLCGKFKHPTNKQLNRKHFMKFPVDNFTFMTNFFQI
jgi:hypothetical protein